MTYNQTRGKGRKGVREPVLIMGQLHNHDLFLTVLPIHIRACSSGYGTQVDVAEDPNRVYRRVRVLADDFRAVEATCVIIPSYITGQETAVVECVDQADNLNLFLDLVSGEYWLSMLCLRTQTLRPH